ncbi:rubredoxin [Candidatus Woesearchaeota archaeon]|nr:rubredoxin [Candidatus Woesearchaeota archaeon]
MAKYQCGVCGYIYDEEAEGTKFSELPADWHCPVCGAPHNQFNLLETRDREGKL